MNQPTTKRYAVPYFPSREGWAPSGHAFLLARDIPLGIMPIRGIRDRPSFKVELVPEDDRREAWLNHFLNIGQYEQDSLDQTIVDFAETASNYVAYCGEVVFEILVDTHGEPFRLDPLPPGRVLRAPGRYLQVISKPDRRQLRLRRLVPIPRKRIWRLTLPPSLGGARRHRHLLRHLGVLSDPIPKFALESPDLGRKSSYDFTAYRDACDRLQERATKRWGTIPSIQRPVGPSTEYFFIARRLAFLRAQAELREHMIAELNRLLARLGVPHSVVVSGIPTAHEIASTLDRLHHGEVTFAAALETTKT